MVSIYQLKSRFQSLLRPLTRRLARAGLTANQVTVATAVGSVALGGFLAATNVARVLFLLLPVWFLLRMALNAIDGMLAREHGQKSRLGAYLNEIGDIVSDAALYLPFAFIAPFSLGWIGALILLAALSEFAGLCAVLVGGDRRYDGPMGKSDRAALFGGLGLWVGLSDSLPDWAIWLMPFMVVLLVWTVINRVRAGLARAGLQGEGNDRGSMSHS